MMRQCGVTMQRVADYSGVSKTDVCRVMNEEMEERGEWEDEAEEIAAG